MYVCECMFDFVCDMNMVSPMRAQTIQEREKEFQFWTVRKRSTNIINTLNF